MEEYEKRDYQVKAIQNIYKDLKEGKNVILSSGTGTGKTFMALTSAIRYAREEGKKIIYLTRTNSQQEHIIKELRKLRSKMEFSAVVMQGRANLCPLYMEMTDERDFDVESLSKLCSIKKRLSLNKNPDGCRYYNGDVFSDSTEQYILQNVHDPGDIFQDFTARGICPYESIKYAMRDADIVVMPYAYMINPNLAISTLYKIRGSRKSVLIIVDEAHNLPEIARESNSFEITTHMIDLAERESVNYGDPEIVPGFRVSDFMELMRNTISDFWFNAGDGTKEGRIMFRDLFEHLAITGKKTPDDISYFIDALESIGMSIEARKEGSNKIPISRILSLAKKLKFMEMGDDERYICLLTREGKNESIETYCMDTSVSLSHFNLSQSMHLSGTIEPVDFYIKLTGLSNYSYHRIESPFDKSNLLKLYCDDVSTKYDTMNEEMIRKIGERLKLMMNSSKRRKIIFFPSFSIMEKIVEVIGNDGILFEERNMSALKFRDMMERFKNGEGTMFSVMGGRSSEGIDLPGSLLEIVGIVGIPFPKPDIKRKSLLSFYDHEFSNGWEYAFLYPAIIKLRQAEGRAIRGLSDRGVVVIFDSRIESIPFFDDYKKCSEDFSEIKNFFGD